MIAGLKKNAARKAMTRLSQQQRAAIHERRQYHLSKNTIIVFLAFKI